MVLVFCSESGIRILVGENAKENDAIRKTARQNFLWFHLEDQPSPHVVVTAAASDVDAATVADAALLCKHYSKLKGTRAVHVIYTICKNVSKVDDRDGACLLRCAPEKRVVYDQDSDLERLQHTLRKTDVAGISRAVSSAQQ